MLIPLLPIAILDFSSYSTLEKDPLNSSIESKIAELSIDSSRLNIIIAGDSRGERHIIPGVIESNTAYNAVNISVTAGDIVSASYAIDSYDSENNVYVISASSWQINDGAISPGYLSLKCFQKLTLIEKIQLYRDNISWLFHLETSLIGEVVESFFQARDGTIGDYDASIINNQGFLGIDDTLKVDKMEIVELIETHAWYRNLKNNGARWRIFKEAFQKLANSGSLILIVQPPASPTWKEMTSNTVIGKAEEEYSFKLDSLCNKYENVIFYDFYTNEIEVLEDRLFYDYQHLNTEGASIFSELFSELISEEIASRNTFIE